MCQCAGTGARAPRKQRGGWKWVSWYMHRVFPTDAGCSRCSRSLADWNDLFMLGLGAACCVTTGLHAKPATVNFRKKKALVSPYLFAMQNPPEQALYARIIWADPGTSAWGFLFECSHVTLHPHPLSKDLGKYPLGRGQTQAALSAAFTKPCIFFIFYFFQ